MNLVKRWDYSLHFKFYVNKNVFLPGVPDCILGLSLFNNHLAFSCWFYFFNYRWFFLSIEKLYLKTRVFISSVIGFSVYSIWLIFLGITEPNRIQIGFNRTEKRIRFDFQVNPNYIIYYVISIFLNLIKTFRLIK